MFPADHEIHCLSEPDGRRFLTSLVLALSLAILSGVPETRADSLDEAWTLARKLNFSAANAMLDGLEPVATGDRERINFARALTLLGVQPRSARKVEEAYRLFGKVVDSGISGEILPWAIYYRARIDQAHRADPDFARAAEQYRSLVQGFPAQVPAQVGFVKLAILRLYVLQEGVSRAAVLADLESASAFLNIPVALRDYHATMADAYLFYDLDKEKALVHLIKAHEQGSLTIIDTGGQMARIGNLAYHLKRWDIAKQYYREFIETNPDAGTVYLLRERLTEIETADASIVDRQ
jgi:tetratricopeptide (TPR) repeat protein